MRTGIYVLPSLLTAANLSLGFYSITASINQDWSYAAWAILASIVVDILDGRTARWTNTTSQFGVEFDSLCDLISFGLAPAVMAYLLVLSDYGRIGFAIALLYVICAALRLARFNLKNHSDQQPEEATPYFSGLPTPAAGGILASFVILYDIWAEGKKARTIRLVMKQIPAFYHLLPGIVFVLSILMVSGLRYSSFKRMNMFKPKSIRAFLITVLVCLMIYIFPQNTIFVMFVGYICSGILEYLWRAYKMKGIPREDRDIKIETPEGNSWEIRRNKKY